jgi:excisionase family DNA binding protein
MHNGITDVDEVYEMDDQDTMFYMCDASRMLSVKEAARQLGIGEAFARRLIRRGEIKSVRLGDRVLVPRHEVERIVEQAA